MICYYFMCFFFVKVIKYRTLKSFFLCETYEKVRLTSFQCHNIPVAQHTVNLDIMDYKITISKNNYLLEINNDHPVALAITVGDLELSVSGYRVLKDKLKLSRGVGPAGDLQQVV